MPLRKSVSRHTFRPRTHGSGIYAITCTATGKIYVGSSVNMTKRYDDHCKALSSGNSRCRVLQKAWNQYGPTAFTFRVLEYVRSRKGLEEFEQNWIDRIGQENLLNMQMTVTRKDAYRSLCCQIRLGLIKYKVILSKNMTPTGYFCPDCNPKNRIPPRIG
jgi:hypothetical protein